MSFQRRLIVEVVGASNLIPKDGQGSASPFVQVEFDGQRKRTQVIPRELNPIWNEVIELMVYDPPGMFNEVLEVTVFDDSRPKPGATRKNKFMGRVSIPGTAFVQHGMEAFTTYKLERKALFSPVKGEIVLRIFYIDIHPDSVLFAARDDRDDELYGNVTNSSASIQEHGVYGNPSASMHGDHEMYESVPIPSPSRHEIYEMYETAPNLSAAKYEDPEMDGNARSPSAASYEDYEMYGDVPNLSAPEAVGYGMFEYVPDTSAQKHGEYGMYGNVPNPSAPKHGNYRVLQNKPISSAAKRRDHVMYGKTQKVTSESSNTAAKQRNDDQMQQKIRHKSSTSRKLHISSDKMDEIRIPGHGTSQKLRNFSEKIKEMAVPVYGNLVANSNDRDPEFAMATEDQPPPQHLTSLKQGKPPDSTSNLAPPSPDLAMEEGQKMPPLEVPAAELSDSDQAPFADSEAFLSTPSETSSPDQSSNVEQFSEDEEVFSIATFTNKEEESIDPPLEEEVTPLNPEADHESLPDSSEILPEESPESPDLAEPRPNLAEGSSEEPRSPNASGDLPAKNETHGTSDMSGFTLKESREQQERPISGKYDLVEKMHYLFVNVMKARCLQVAPPSSGGGVYARLVLGNQVATTSSASNPLILEWSQVFAFGHIHSDTLEISILDCNSNTLLGKLSFDICEIPSRFPHDSPLTPQWYPLHQTHQESNAEIQLALWIGSQADEAFCEAWLSDSGGYNPITRAKIYLSPKLWYLRVNVIEAQDLVVVDNCKQLPEVSVKAQVGFQVMRTRIAKRHNVSPFWNEDLLFVASEPMEETLIINVEEHQGLDKHILIGMTRIPLHVIDKRMDDRQVLSKWFNLQNTMDGTPSKTFQGRIHLRLSFDGGYHVMDESPEFCSDLRPSSKELWKTPIGVLELGILGAQNLLPMKTKDGQGTIDAYCVAKYGPKWARTRTIIDNLSPRWNEQYTWEVYDPCTVLTLCVFDNGEVNHEAGKNMDGQKRHSRVGKVRVRLSTLEVGHVYPISYPLLLLQPGGLKKVGDLELVIRFMCPSMFNLIQTYTQPLLPSMHYLCPLSIHQEQVLGGVAMKMVALKMEKWEPSLKPEVVQYVLDSENSRWSLRRSKANWGRIEVVLGGVSTLGRWMNDIRQWRNPLTTLLVHLLLLILLCYPELILPTIFFYMFLIGVWQYKSRVTSPTHVDPKLSHVDMVDVDLLDEELDTIPTSKPPDLVKARYERLRGLAARVQILMADVAAQGERVQALLTWRDPHATSLFVVLCFLVAIILYVAPFRAATFLFGVHFLRHPRLRDPLPSPFLNFFQRLPTLSDHII